MIVGGAFQITFALQDGITLAGGLGFWAGHMNIILAVGIFEEYV